eukprot:367015-Prymnesium_polylepis.1
MCSVVVYGAGRAHLGEGSSPRCAGERCCRHISPLMRSVRAPSRRIALNAALRLALLTPSPSLSSARPLFAPPIHTSALAQLRPPAPQSRPPHVGSPHSAHSRGNQALPFSRTTP